MVNIRGKHILHHHNTNKTKVGTEYIYRRPNDHKWNYCNPWCQTTDKNFLPCLLNKKGNLRIPYQWGAFKQSHLVWKNNKNQISWLSVRSLNYPAWRAHSPYYVVICDLSGFLFHIISKNSKIFEKKKSYWKLLMFSFSLQIFPKHFSL